MRLTFCLSTCLIPKLALLFFALLCIDYLYAQEYSYTQYNIKEGLAGSTVYCATQDKDGFMWFGTETGLSRFDGSSFKNFTTEDGLTDNEILKMFCDSKGRLWLSLFKKDICYYYKGKIYNRYNDSILSRLHLMDLAWQICEDDYGNILIAEGKELHEIDSAGKITEITGTGNRLFQYCAGISKSFDGNFFVLDMDTLYDLKNKNEFSTICTIHLVYPAAKYIKLTSKYLLWGEESSTLKIMFLVNKKTDIYQFTQ